MELVKAFIIGGIFCVIGQILIDKTKLTPARILVGYVVMGVFSSEQNAQRAVEQLRSKIKDAAAEVRPFGDKYMVTAFGSDKREECNVFVRSYHDIYPDLWVYNKK